MAKKPNSSNNHSDLLKELFQAAVELRGSIEPSDYKKYVLPLVFLRFLSLRFDEVVSFQRAPEQIAKALPGAQPKRDIEQAVRDLEGDDRRTRELGLDEDELAFYDAVAANLPGIYGQVFLAGLVHQVVESVKRNLKVDWTRPHRESVKAGVRAAVRRVLRRNNVRAEDLEPFVDAILEQAEALYGDWPRAA